MRLSDMRPFANICYIYVRVALCVDTGAEEKILINYSPDQFVHNWWLLARLMQMLSIHAGCESEIKYASKLSMGIGYSSHTSNFDSSSIRSEHFRHLHAVTYYPISLVHSNYPQICSR